MRKEALFPTKNTASAKNKAEARCEAIRFTEVSDEDAIRVVGGIGSGGWGHDIAIVAAADGGSSGWGHD